jgi:GntR family transcriptional regulator
MAKHRPNKRVRAPLQDVVRDGLRQSIAEGEYRPGDRLPSESELAERFEVSRLTLREAVRGLVTEGYVTRRQGLGTFVTKRPRLRNNLDENFGVTHFIEALGMTPGNRDVDILEEEASDRVAAALDLEPGSPVIRVDRVRTADGDPIVCSTEYIPSHCVPNGAGDLEGLEASLYDLLADLGHPVSHGVATIKSVVADRELARRLSVRAGAPVLYLEQIDYGRDDAPTLFALEWYDSEDVEVTVYRKGPLRQ